MASLDQIRQRYPSARDLTDNELIAKLSEITETPYEQVASRFGFDQKTSRGFLGAAKDYAIEAANAAAGLAKGVTDFVSPGNAAGQFIQENIIEPGEARQSVPATLAKRQLQRGLQSDEIMPQLGAVASYVGQNPLLAASQAVGSFGPIGGAMKGAQVASGLAGLGARGAARVGLGTSAGLSGAAAGGDAGSAAYELVMNTPWETVSRHPQAVALIDAGANPDQVYEELATRAARNASVVPAIIGAVSGATGAESALASGVKGFKGVAKKVGAETLGETFEEGTTQYAGQAAAQEYNPEINPMRGVVGAGALGGALGAMVATPISIASMEKDLMAPTEKPKGLTAQTEPQGEPPRLGFSPLAGTPVVFPDGSVTLGSEQELLKRYGANQTTTALGLNQPYIDGDLVNSPGGNVRKPVEDSSVADPMDLTVANPAQAAASAKLARDPRAIELRDTFGVIPTPQSLQLYSEIQASGVPLDSDLLAPVWAYAGERHMTPKRLAKAQQLLDAAIIEARKGATNVSQTTAPIPAAATGVATGGPVVSGSVGLAGPSVTSNVQPSASAPVVGTPTGQAQPAPAPSSQPAAPVIQGKTNGPQAPQAKQAETQGQQPPAADTAVAVAQQRVEDELVRVFGERDAGILYDAIAEGMDHGDVATKHGLSRGRVAQMAGSGATAQEFRNAKFVEAGSSQAKLRQLLSELSEARQAQQETQNVVVDEVSLDKDLLDAGLGTASSIGGAQGNWKDGVSGRTRVMSRRVAVELAELKDALQVAQDGNDEARADELEARIKEIEGRYVSAEERAAGLTQEAFEIAQKMDALQAKIDAAREAGQTTIATKDKKQTLEEAEGVVESYRLAVQLKLKQNAKLLEIDKQLRKELEGPIVKAEDGVSEKEQAALTKAKKERAAQLEKDRKGLVVGDTVVNPKLGTGTVLSFSGNGAETFVKVEFLNGQTKDLSVQAAKLEKTNAVQVQSPTGLSVQPKAEAGQGVGQEVRSTEKPAGARQVEAKVLTSQEQYEKVTAGFPAPAWADLTPTQKSKLADLAIRDQLNLAAVNRYVTTEEKAAPIDTNTPEQIAQAERHAAVYGGTVVWQEGDVALVRGYSLLSGKPVYMPTKGALRWGKDIESLSPPELADVKTKMVAAKNELEAADAAKHVSSPFVTFDKNGLAVSTNVDTRLANVVAGWKNLLNLNANIYVTTIDDARADKAKFTGPHRVVGSAGLDANEAGSMRKMDDGYYIAFTKGTSYLKMLETIGHELGHVHEREAFANAPAALKSAIRAEHDKFLKSQTGASGKQFVEALRARAVGRSTTGVDNIKADQLTPYWKSFSEWYADQVSKWATTSEKPVGVVEQFFAKLGAALKKFYYSLKGAKYLPSETMKQFLDDVANRTIVVDPTKVSDDRGSQPILGGVRSFRSKTSEAVAETKAQLAIAKLMDANGDAAEDIWADTGWYKNPVDSKWRFEVPDTGAKLKENIQLEKDTEYELGDVLDHSALYEAYPQLKEYKIEFDGDIPAGHGGFSEGNKKITVSWFGADNMQVLLHEVQHAVQAIEDFSRGGNPDMVLPYDIPSLKKLRGSIKETGSEPFGIKSSTVMKLIAVLERYNTAAAQAELEGSSKKFDAAQQTMENQYEATLNADGANLRKMEVALYQLIAGEQEAELVANRSKPGGTGFGPRPTAPINKVSAANQLVNNKNVYAAKTAPDQGMIAKNISKLPKGAQQPVRNMLGAISDVTGKGLDYLVFTSDLVNRATKEGISSAKRFVDLIGQSKAEARANEIAVEKIADMYALVPEKERGTGDESVNRFLFDSTRESKWGYGQYRDEVMGDRFDKLSKESQAFVEAVFKHGSTMLAAKKKLVMDSTNSEYDAMIAVARASGDKAAESKLLNEKKATIKRFQTLFKIRDGMPYAPIKRNGSHVVIAKSASYLAAEAANDTKLIEKLEADSDHYHVSFTDGKWEGRTLQQELLDQGAFESVELAERDSVVDEMYSGHSALRELTKMRSRVDEQAKAGDKSASKMLNLISQMYLEALAEGSARKSEMRRRGVAGEVDMIRSFAQQGRADANFMASVKYNPQVQDALQEMRTQAKSGNRERKSELLNELAKRYIQSMEYSPSPWLNKLTRMSSIYYLATSPAYYLQNLTQPWMMSVPAMAGQHDYSAASSALFKAYTELGGVMKSAKLLKQQFDFDKVPADVRDAIKELVNRGKIDIGLDTEIGEFKVGGDSYLAQKISNADKALRLAVQKVESINRLSTAMAAYRLHLEKNKGDVEGAVNYADRILTETHGDYTSFNAPRAFNTGVGKIALQFRKFQLIQLAFYAKLIKDALQGNDRKAALATLGYSLSHTAVLAGLMGLPGYAAIAWALGAAFGDDDEPYDLTTEIRKAIGDESVANLVLRGAPTLAGMDISGKVGAGNMLSIMPFSDADLSTTAGRAEALGTLVGGASLGMTSRMVDGLGLMLSGDWYRGLEQTMPKGISDAMKAYRIANEGMTRRNGDVVLPASEISTMDSLFQAIGISPVQQTVAYERQNAVKALTQNFQARTTEIKNQYAKAVRNGDTAAMTEARDAWIKLQAAKAKNGLPRKPLSDLLKAPAEQRKRERETAGGVPYTKATKKLVQQYSEV